MKRSILVPCLFVSSAQALLGFGETSESERGPFVESILRESGLPPQAQWDLAFIHHVGWWSQREAVEGFSEWPLPRSTTHRDLAALAQEKRIARVEPEAGDIVLYWSQEMNGYPWAGIIAGVDCARPIAPGIQEYLCVTIEGNVTAQGAHGGPTVHVFRRWLSAARGDRFVRWAALDPIRVIATPGAHHTRYAGRLVLAHAAVEGDR